MHHINSYKSFKSQHLYDLLTFLFYIYIISSHIHIDTPAAAVASGANNNVQYNVQFQ